MDVLVCIEQLYLLLCRCRVCSVVSVKRVCNVQMHRRAFLEAII